VFVTAAGLEVATEALHEDLEGLPRAERTSRLLAAASLAPPLERAALEVRVVEINMTVAAQIAARYRGRGVPAEDMEQVAYMALVKAVRRYEYAPERDFLSFAVPTIRGEIKRYFRDQGWSVRPPRTIQAAQAQIGRAEGELLQELGRSPRPGEIAERLGLDLELVVEALGANGCFLPTSLEAAMLGDDSTTREWLGDEDTGFHRVEIAAMIKPLLAKLTERERLMLEMRFFQDATQAEIGAVLGLSQNHVSRSLSSLMARLRDQVARCEPSPTDCSTL
jgi:RNA polymerase sigma-B factor